MKKVLILYKFLPQYRVDFFNQLNVELSQRGIELILLYGKIKDSQKKDEVDIPWAIYKENKIIKIGKTDLMWQPSIDYIKKSDLIIVEHANKLLINYLLMTLRMFTKKKLAFWGHGRNMQGNENGLRNRLKYFYISFCDHWFAYTGEVKKFLIAKNVSEDMISVVNNAIDTKTLRKQYLDCSKNEVIKVKKDLGIEGKNIAIYSGALYNIKKIDFLIESAIKIRKKIDDFHLIVIGSGADEDIVKSASKEYPWIHHIGAKFGEDRVVYFRLASLFMLPGAVGLAILDAFATETPMVTTDMPLHGPEVSYLEDNINGAMTKFDVQSYSDKVATLFQDNNALNVLKEGCVLASDKYTVEYMVKSFADGIDTCLNG